MLRNRVCWAGCSHSVQRPWSDLKEPKAPATHPCRLSCSKTQGVKWSDPVHVQQGRHIPAPLLLGSTPAGLGQSWTVKNTEGTATGWQVGPHAPRPTGQQVSLRRYPAASFIQGSFPIKHPGHGMENSRALSSCSRIAGTVEGQLWGGGPGRPEREGGEAPACLPCTPVSSRSPSSLRRPCYPAGCGRCPSH